MSSDLQHSAERLRRRGTGLAIAFILLIAAGLGVGAWQLARSQSHDRRDLRTRYGSRAIVASALIDSLFRLAFQQQAQQAAERFAGQIDPAKLAAFAKRGQEVYAAVLDQRGRVLAATNGAPASPGLSILAPALKGGLAVSDLMRTGGRQVIESAVAFPARGGARVLVGGSAIGPFRQFLTGSLKPLTPVEGGGAYVIDGHGNVISAVSAGRPRHPPQPSSELISDSAKSSKGFYDLRGQQRYFAATSQPHTSWRLVISAPTSALYKPASGVSRWLPWVILGILAFALLAIAYLVRSAISAGARIAVTNAELAHSQERLRERAVELQQANEELQRSNSELEQFAYVASHDLSAPLRAVAGFSQLLGVRYRGKLDASADEFIEHMQSGVDRMQRIIDDLLAYSRVDRSGLEPEPVDLEATLAEVLGALGPEIAERRAVVTHDPLPMVSGDPGQLSQVLQNLIANGIKFTAPGVSPHVHVAAAPTENGRLRIAVRDNGIGIDPGQVERIFKMFQRLHGTDEYPGTGIGLAVTQKIVERHGGRVSVEPAPGGGSVFAFDVPAEWAATAPPAPAEPRFAASAEESPA